MNATKVKDMLVDICDILRSL